MGDHIIQGVLVGYTIEYDQITLKVEVFSFDNEPYKATMNITNHLKSQPTMEELQELDSRIESGLPFLFRIQAGAK